jgi:hypothetical protein
MTDVSDILRDGAETFEKKTTDYGESWRNIGDILHIMANGQPVVLETPEEIVAFGLFTRRLDKLSREFYGTFFADSMNFEGPIDSAEDESVYAAMSASNLYTMMGHASEPKTVTVDYERPTDPAWEERRLVESAEAGRVPDEETASKLRQLFDPAYDAGDTDE